MKIIQIAFFILVIGLIFYISFSHLLLHSITKIDKKDIINCKQSEKSFIISISEKGFNPQSIEIHACDEIKFLNTGNKYHEPAFGDHPKHLLYPGFKELVLKPGQHEDIIMSAIGYYKIHDHIYDELWGNIIVDK